MDLDTRCLHFHTERPLISAADLIPQLAILNDRVARGDSSAMEDEFAFVVVCP